MVGGSPVQNHQSRFTLPSRRLGPLETHDRALTSLVVRLYTHPISLNREGSCALYRSVYNGPMDSTLQDRLQELMTHLDAEEVRLQRELDVVRRIREPIQQSLREVRESALGRANGGSQSVVTGIASDLIERDASSGLPRDNNPGGLPRGVTRKQIVEQIVPEIKGQPFEPRDIRERFLERYPQADASHFPQAISNILREMAEKGEIKRLGRKGDARNDPFIYQANDSQEESLALEP